MAWIFIALAGVSEKYENKARQTMAAELIMQGNGTYYLGRTIKFEIDKNIHASEFALQYQIFFIGPIYTLITTVFSIVGLLAGIAGLRKAKGDDREDYRQGIKTRCVLAIVPIFFGTLAFVGRWLFLIGYLNLAEDGCAVIAHSGLNRTSG